MSEPDRRWWEWLRPRAWLRAAELPAAAGERDAAAAGGNGRGRAPTRGQFVQGWGSTDLALLASGVLDSREQFERWMRYTRMKENFKLANTTLKLVIVALGALGASALQVLTFGDPDPTVHRVGVAAMILMVAAAVGTVALAMLSGRKRRSDQQASAVDQDDKRREVYPE